MVCVQINERITDLNSRMERSEQGNPTDLLSDEAVEVADLLWQEAMASPGGEWYLTGIVIAWMYWSRGHAGAVMNEREVSIATCLFAVLSEIDPMVVPPGVHEGVFAVLGDSTPEPIPVRAILRHFSDPAVFNLAIDLVGRAIPARPAGDSRFLGLLDCEIVMRSARFLHSRDRADMDIAIDAMRRRLAETPAVGAPGPTMATPELLASWLQQRYEQRTDERDLAEAIAVVRDALASTLLADDDAALLLSQLCYLQQLKYQRNGSVVELDEGIEAGRRAVRLAATDHPELASMHGHLGLALRQRYQQSGDLRCLDEAVAVGRLGIAAAEVDDPYRPMLLSGLGLALRARYRHLGATNDLDEAVSVSRTAVEAADDNHPDLGSCLSNLALALRVRFGRQGDLSDLDEAIQIIRRAIAVVPENHHNRPRMLMNLGLLLRARFKVADRAADIEAAITTIQQLIAEAANDIPLKADALNNLGLALHARYDRNRQLADLEASVVAHRSAVDATAVGTFDWSAKSMNLADACFLRHTVTSSVEDRDYAASAWADVASSPLAQADIRLRAARQRAEVVGHRDGAAAALPPLRTAVGLLSVVAWRGLDRDDQLRLLTQVSGSVAADAGAAACAARQLDDACELLEEGRAVLWQQLAATRTPFNALKQVRPDLADALGACRDEIEGRRGPIAD